MPKPGDKVTKPKQDESVTQDQIDSALNIAKFSGASPDKDWHQGPDGGGIFESWTMKYGYGEGFALYGGVKFSGASVHIYYLANTEQTILLKERETPAVYGH
jgi:hypothetical protein